jgi:5'/3'-nucleotidase SurE
MFDRIRSYRSPSLLAAAVALLASANAAALDVALSNDDGWSSIGVQAAKRALVAAGHRVTLAAPLDEQSGSSAAINTSGLLIRKEQDDDGALEYSVAVAGGEGAEPATSALVAVDIARQRGGRLPDLLVSGINAGANVGAFTQVSGTVGAAIVGLASTFNGSVPSIAISTDPVCAESTPECEAQNEAHFARVADFLVAVIAHLERKPGFLASEPALLPLRVGLNINYPPREVPAGVVVTQQGQTAVFGGGGPITLGLGCYGPCATVPVGTTLPGGITGISPDPAADVRNSDTAAFSAGYITVVPITPNYTADSPLRFKSVFSTLSY